MALFKVFRGSSKDLPSVIHDGYAYLTTDDGKFYIDTSNKRILINPDTSSAQKISYIRDGVMTNVGAVLDDLTSSSVSIESHSTEEWQEEGRAISKQGIFYIYSDGYKDEEGNDIPRIKLGDGMAYISDLPFLDAPLLNMIIQHINNEAVHITQQQRLFWNNKININDSQQVIDNALVFNRN